MYVIKYGIFVYNENTRQYWFNRNSFESANEYRLIGMVIGLAIYNGVILDIHFPEVVYRKLCGKTLTIEDIESYDPEIYRSMKQTKEYNGDISDFCLTFAVTYQYFGETKTYNLKPNGVNIDVTEDNKHEYINLLKKYYLEDAIRQQFNAFQQGFLEVVGGPALGLFAPKELENLICGNPVLDFDALQATAQYEGGYYADHELILWLWEVLEEFNERQKRKFLMFATGSDRAPIRGLQELKFKTQRVGPERYEGPHLPTSHTVTILCFYHIIIRSHY